MTTIRLDAAGEGREALQRLFRSFAAQGAR